MMRFLIVAALLLGSSWASAAITWPSGSVQDACHVQPSTKAAACASQNKLFRITWDNCNNGAGGGGPGFFNHQCSTSTGHSLSDVCSVSSPDFNANWCAQNGGAPDYGCPPGVPYVNGQCAIDDDGPTECGEGYSKFTVGNKTSCIEQMPSQCGNGGKIWVNGVDACQDEKDACNNAGGTFGIVNTSPVCIPSDYANQLPTCASGSAEYFDNGNGTSAFACATVTTPAGERAPVNVTAEDPTGLGGKFDEVIQALERGTAVLRSGMGGAVPPVAGGTGPGQGGQQPGEGEGGEEGEGECDPTATDYASCIGNTNLVGDNDASDLIGDAETAGTTALDGMETEWIDSLDESLPIDEPTGIKAIIQGLFPAPTECQEIGYDWQGGRITLDCGKLNDFKAWLGFMLYFFTAFTIYQIVMAPPAGKV